MNRSTLSATDRSRIDRVKALNSIIDVASRLGFNLPQHKLSARLVKAVCLLHKEKDASFTIYPHEGRFYCYGCKKNGDVIALYMAATRKSFAEALDDLDGGRMARVVAARPTTPPPPPTPTKHSIEAINQAARWFHRRLFDRRNPGGPRLPGIQARHAPHRHGPEARLRPLGGTGQLYAAEGIRPE